MYTLMNYSGWIRGDYAPEPC